MRRQRPAALVLLPAPSRRCRAWAAVRTNGASPGTVFVQFWLTSTPALPEPAAKAARATARSRYDGFVAALGRRLNEGPKLRQEIPDDVQASPNRDQPGVVQR